MSRWPKRNEDLHRKLHVKPKPLRYEPIPVSEALKAMNSYVKTAVELGTHSFLANERTIAMHIIELEHAIDNTAYQLLIHASLTVGHNIEKAMGSLPLYIYVAGIDKITDAFKDLAYLSLMGYSPSEELYKYYIFLSDVITSRIEGSVLKGKEIGWLKEEFAVEPIAILRGSNWILIPQEAEIIRAGDKVYMTGIKENINELLEAFHQQTVTGTEPPEDIEGIMSDIDSMIDIVKLLNDLAHYQLKAQDPQMVEEVMEIEMFMDSLRLRVSEKIMDTRSLDNKDKFALLSLVTRLEDVTDAMTYSLTLPAKDEYKEILSRIVEASGEKVKSFHVNKVIPIVKLSEDLEEFGAAVLAVRKGNEWVAVTPYNIGKLKAEPNDSVLLMYPAVLEEDVLEYMSKHSNEAKVEEED